MTGRVQGVGFRWWASQQARELRLSGTVRNAADGSVELEVGGSDEAIAELRERLRAGPPAAAVVRVEEVPASGGDLPWPFRIVG